MDVDVCVLARAHARMCVCVYQKERGKCRATINATANPQRTCGVKCLPNLVGKISRGQPCVVEWEPGEVEGLHSIGAGHHVCDHRRGPG